MRVRKLTAVVLAAGLALAACGGDDSGSSDTTAADGTGEQCGGVLADVKPLEGVEFTPVKADTFTVVTSLPGPGFWNGIKIEDVTSGLEYCMARVIGLKLGMAKFEARNEDFTAITTGVVSEYDLALTQSSITDERKQVVDFTEPYYKSDQSILTKAGVTVETLDDVRQLVLGVQGGTTGEYFADELIKPVKPIQRFDKLDAAYTALNAGQVDAVVMDTAINLGQAKLSNGALTVPAQFANEDYYGGILPKGSPNLAAINAALAAIEADGTLKKLIDSELGGDPSQVKFIELG